MRIRSLGGFLTMVLLSSFTAPPVFAQQAPEEETLMPENVTQILKEEWTFLRDETNTYLKAIEKRGEFETSPEFELRVANTKAGYINKVNLHARERKYDKRNMSALFKATLASFNPDAGVYSVRCDVNIEAPYDIPALITFVPTNPYLGITDTVRGGYRMSKLYLKFKPDLKWKVTRDVAQSAKGDEANVYFKVRFVLDLSQEGIVKQAKLKVVPKEIVLMNTKNKMVFWRQEIR